MQCEKQACRRQRGRGRGEKGGRKRMRRKYEARRGTTSQSSLLARYTPGGGYYDSENTLLFVDMIALTEYTKYKEKR